MNDKEFNLAILNKLYEIAAKVWAKMAKNDFGAYTAKQIDKGLGKYFWWADVDVTESNTITEGSYSCTFPNENIWYYISVFEKLAAVGKNAKVFVHEEVGDVIGSCTFLLNKGANELCKFVAKDELRPSLGMVCLSPKHHCLVASDGFKMSSYPIEITEFSGDMDNFLIDTKLFAQMCKGMAKNGSYIVTATKEKKGIREYCKLSFNSVCSCIDSFSVGRYARWDEVIPEVSNYNCITLKRGNIDALKDIQKFIGRNKEAVVYMEGTEGHPSIKVTIGDNVRDITIGSYVLYDFKIALRANLLLAADNIEKLYLGCKASMPLAATNEYGSIYILMPLIREDNYENKVYYESGKFNASASDYVGYDTTSFCDDMFYSLLDIRTDSQNNRLQALETAKIVSNTTEQNKVAEESAKVAKSEKSNVVTKSVTTKAAGTTNKEQRKFTFEKVGIKPGDVLTFVDGTEVTATAYNKVEFCGEVFTLSGFTKQFTPNPTKSGAYRGCDWFYKDGVKLSKLFKQYLDGLDSVPDEVAATAKEEVTEQKEVSIPERKDVALDSERKELPPPPPVIYIDVDNLPNDTASEPQKATRVPLEVESEVITPQSKENVSGAKKTTFLQLDVGTLARVVAITLGVPIEYGTPPPRYVGGAKVVNSHYIWAAENYSLTAGKVVHELPLPPPKQNKTNLKLIIYGKILRKWSRDFGCQGC